MLLNTSFRYYKGNSRKIEKDCREQGVKVVATSTPVLGVFNL